MLGTEGRAEKLERRGEDEGAGCLEDEGEGRGEEEGDGGAASLKGVVEEGVRDDAEGRGGGSMRPGDGLIGAERGRGCESKMSFDGRRCVADGCSWFGEEGR